MKPLNITLHDSFKIVGRYILREISFEETCGRHGFYQKVNEQVQSINYLRKSNAVIRKESPLRTWLPSENGQYQFVIIEL